MEKFLERRLAVVSGLIGRRFLRARSRRGSGQFVEAGPPCVGVTCPGCGYGGRAVQGYRQSSRFWPRWVATCGTVVFPEGVVTHFCSDFPPTFTRS